MRALLDRELDLIAGGLFPVNGDGPGGGSPPPAPPKAQTFTSPSISGSASDWTQTVSVNNDTWTAAANHDVYHGTYTESLTGNLHTADKFVQAQASYDSNGHWNGSISLNYAGNQLAYTNAGQTSFSHDFGNGFKVSGNYIGNSAWSLGFTNSFNSGGFNFNLGGTYGSGGYSMSAGVSYDLGL